MNCYDVVEMVTKDVPGFIRDGYSEDPARVAFLKECCKDLDAMVEKFNGASLDVAVDPETFDITISLVCDEFDEKPRDSEFLHLVHNAKKVRLSRVDDMVVRIEFTYGGVWIRGNHHEQ